MEKFKELLYLIKEKWQMIVLSIVILVSFSVMFIGVYVANKDNKQVKVETKSEKNVIEKIGEEIQNTTINYRVEIKGEVVKPGVYTLDSEKRVIDVVNKAQGFTKNADSSVINLSKKIEDEMVIVIYSKKEVEDFVKTKEQEQQKVEICKQDYVVENDACVDSKENAQQENTTDNSSSDAKTVNNKISINTATLEELMMLSGIGESKAQSIIDYRTKEGKFTSIEDIMNVNGIGEALFEKIKNDITV